MPRLVSTEALEAAGPLLQRLLPLVHMLAGGTADEAQLRRLLDGQQHHLTDETTDGTMAHTEYLRLAGETRHAWAAAAVLLALVESSDHYRSRWWPKAALWYVRAATAELAETPSGPLFVRASAIAGQLVDTGRRAGNNHQLVEALLASAVLRHDLYLLGAYPLMDWLDDELGGRRRWLQAAKVGFEALDTEPIPHPAQALDEALGFVHEIHEIGIAPEAWAVGAGALAGLMQLGVGDVTDTLVVDYARAGLRVVDRQATPVAFLLLIRALLSAGGSIELDRHTLMPVEYASLMAQGWTVVAYHLVRVGLEIAKRAHRPDLIRLILNEARWILPGQGQHRLRQVVWEAEVHSFDTEASSRWPADVAALEDESRRCRSLAKRLRRGKRAVAKSLVHLSAHMLEAGAPDRALALSWEAMQIAPALLRDSEGPAVVFTASIANDAAARVLAQAGDHVGAAFRHAVAVNAWADLRLEQRILEGLEAVDRCIQKGGLEASLRSLPLVGEAAPKLASYAIDDPEWPIFEICSHACGGLRHDQPPLGLLTLVHQIAKGRSFSVAAIDASPLDLDAAEQELVRAVARAESVGSEPAVQVEPADFRGELFLTGTLWSGEAVGQLAPIASIQRTFELRHHTRLSWRSQPERYPYLRVSDVEGGLTERTVLLSLYVGTGQGGARLTALAFTRRGTQAKVVDLGEPLLGFGATFRISPLAYQCWQLRQAIRDDPLFRVVSREAEDWLTRDPTRWLGFDEDALAEWRSQGYDHLCVWPHGPLHFAPFHLVSPGGVPLADEWTVTTLPSLAPLVSGPREPAVTNRSLVSLASPNGGDLFGLPREDAVVQQATTVAALFGEQPLVGGQATPRRFLDEIEHARYVHVAAHGSLTEMAPSFQCLYLGDGSADGRVYAHDIMTRDLRSVELVTFSACESALGRFDQGDNLRGLLEAVFVTGTSSMVGCLWPVHPDVAGAFFEGMYGALADGRSRLASFRAAQRATRAQFPQYRDWGAFCFMGDWREPDGGEK